MLIGNRYELHEQIGAGGMGAVFRGSDRLTGEIVAIKHLKPEAITGEPDMIERFKREGEALRQLNHSNIVAIQSRPVITALPKLHMEFVVAHRIGHDFC